MDTCRIFAKQTEQESTFAFNLDFRPCLTAMNVQRFLNHCHDRAYDPQLVSRTTGSCLHVQYENVTGAHQDHFQISTFVHLQKENKFLNLRQTQPEFWTQDNFTQNQAVGQKKTLTDSKANVSPWGGELGSTPLERFPSWAQNIRSQFLDPAQELGQEAGTGLDVV